MTMREASRKHGKKGQVEVHFNWIFVLIIGAVILVFFLMVIAKQKTVSNQRLAADVLSNMELILTGQGVSVGREDIVNIPEIPFKFTCDDYGMMEMTKRTGNAIIFAPDAIESEQLITWTQSWDIPFKISNVLYLTSPDIRYHLIYDTSDPEATQFALELNESLPERMDKVMTTDPATIQYENTDKVRLVYIFFEGTPALPPSFVGLNDKVVSALAIQKNEEDVYNGGALLAFYKKQGNALAPDALPAGGAVFASLGKAPVFGAVFADNAEMYDCTMRKAVKRLKYVAMIYTQRANSLLAAAVPRCATYYSAASFTQYALFDPDEIAGNVISPTVTDLFAIGQALKNLNINTIRASCTTLY
ncbi:hypothetical protein HY488_01745 [Candidatus Woesearchaeota archaeon]|nr:hypothetical protein [Candidatus Woesearchaeota archaeon]